MVNVVSSCCYGWEKPLLSHGGDIPLRVPRARLVRAGLWEHAASTRSALQSPGEGRPGPCTHIPVLPPPHPQCPSKTFGTFSSTKDFPDDVIQFARNHPLMFNPVPPLGGRPLFLQVGAGYSFTQIAVDRVAAADGHYDVLFIGTGLGPSPLCLGWPPLLPDAALIVPAHLLHQPVVRGWRPQSGEALR